MAEKLFLGAKNCLLCSVSIKLNVTRDIIRKKFCSHYCRQKYMVQNDPRYLINFYKGKLLCNTPEANAKKAHHKEKHPLYIKDRSLLKGRDMCGNAEFRTAVFKRDNYTCQLCGQRGGRLQVDHIKPYCAFPELRTDISNGRTLCVSCHKKTDTYGSKARKYIKQKEQYGTL